MGSLEACTGWYEAFTAGALPLHPSRRRDRPSIEDAASPGGNAPAPGEAGTPRQAHELRSGSRRTPFVASCRRARLDVPAAWMQRNELAEVSSAIRADHESTITPVPLTRLNETFTSCTVAWCNEHSSIPNPLTGFHGEQAPQRRGTRPACSDRNTRRTEGPSGIAGRP